MRMNKAFLAVSMGLLMACGQAGAQTYAPQMDAKVSGSLLSASYVVGLRAGQGVLKDGDEERKFNIGGISFLSIGLAGGPFKGRVTNLSSWDDFEGTYSFAEAGIAYGLGAGVQRWSNEKGVVIELAGVEVGAELKFGPGVLRISFVK